jgi:DNA-binding NarL/FixJ family response regulator
LPISPSPATRVVLADDHTLFRDGIRLLLQSQPGYEVVGEVDRLDLLQPMLRETRPDLLLVDQHMPGGDTSALIRHLKHTKAELRIVVLTGSSSGAVLKQLAEVQADAVLLKDGSAASFLVHLKAVMAGQRVIPPDVQALIEQTDGMLTRREMQIVKLICDGQSNAEMADTLSLSPKTVDKHRENLMRKLQVNSVAQLVRKARELGWLD